MRKKKKGIIGILNNPAKGDNSHSAGWNRIVRDLVSPYADFLTEKDDWSSYDELMICHGPNYRPGSYNVIGGVTDGLIKRIQMLVEHNGIVTTFDDFKINEFVEKRSIDVDLSGLPAIYKVVFPKKDSVVIGDSHSISVWPDDSFNIIRKDGRTLFGALRDGDLDKARENYKGEIVSYFGNIDIRFHLARQENPEAAVVKLAEEYVSKCNELGIRPTHLLPVESENRKMPKSGMYKGEPFFGRRDLRWYLVGSFNLVLDTRSKLTPISWPQGWYDNPDWYEENVMEPRQSVHIRPKHYLKELTEGTLF